LDLDYAAHGSLRRRTPEVRTGLKIEKTLKNPPDANGMAQHLWAEAPRRRAPNCQHSLFAASSAQVAYFLHSACTDSCLPAKKNSTKCSLIAFHEIPHSFEH